ncbi:hypothetical protein TUMSATVNIG1_58510 (plasmid) [Vibrio nigripulchritudo]|uniref:hypothetical protein n=1 Tax=Vibrio nigripulchritudo TaxID=28173 RepID=UPI001909810C|nr:hypothetical protein [Vibrio nigripulchritudo]BCL73866.1 hypothetical protein VNTUMSATTG_58030 [Vibrio nigripulchritudo]BDU35242.1 hypothetical protein TUMSATVNIG1_58510 [Vibrio nigripulchritudo]
MEKFKFAPATIQKNLLIVTIRAHNTAIKEGYGPVAASAKVIDCFNHHLIPNKYFIHPGREIPFTSACLWITFWSTSETTA